MILSPSTIGNRRRVVVEFPFQQKPLSDGRPRFRVISGLAPALAGRRLVLLIRRLPRALVHADLRKLRQRPARLSAEDQWVMCLPHVGRGQRRVSLWHRCRARRIVVLPESGKSVCDDGQSRRRARLWNVCSRASRPAQERSGRCVSWKTGRSAFPHSAHASDRDCTSRRFAQSAPAGKAISGSETLIPRVGPFVPQRDSNGTKAGIVDREDLNGSAANRCLSDQIRTVPFKMVAPPVSSRMKEFDDFAGFRIPPGNVWTLVLIAVQAGQCKVL